MAEKIEGFLKKGDGPYFVVVGSAHLVGARGIVGLLKGKGYKAKQVRRGAKAEEKIDRSAYRVLGHDRGKVAIVDAKGNLEWESPCRAEGHDIALLPSGNVLVRLDVATIGEVNKDKKVVWKYESKPKPGYTGRVEAHAFQRLDKGITMIAESGNRRIIEVDRAGKIVHEVPLTVDRPGPHR